LTYYNYSVKKLLSDYFGKNTLPEMRRRHETYYPSDTTVAELTALKWQYADEQALQCFTISSIFLLDTVICDDYIAYIGQSGEDKVVFLLFMISNHDLCFHIETEYAAELSHEWEAKGYKVRIMCEDVVTDRCGDEICIRGCVMPGWLHMIKRVNGRDMLVFPSEPCWENYYRKVKAVSAGADITEYECLFAPDVTVTEGKENKTILYSGIDGVMEFFSTNPPVEIVYEKYKNTESYLQEIIIGKRRIELYVDRLNRLCELHLLPISGETIIEEPCGEPISLVERIPPIIGIRVLDPAEMHALAVQINYGAGDLRNYYIVCFEDIAVPKVCNVDGYEFTWEILCSACADGDGNLHFSNGYTIPKHILYYHSYRQVEPEYTQTTVYDKGGIKIRSLYRLPLIERKSLIDLGQHWGHCDECFGPRRAWLDDSGKRLCDIALLCIDGTDEYDDENVRRVVAEPSDKYGFLKSDGSWLFPPIYKKAESVGDRCINATRIVDGAEKSFLLTGDGSENPLDGCIDMQTFANGRCAFNIEKWNGSKPSLGYYNYDDIYPGKWGFVDSDGNIVIKPEYAVVTGFYEGSGEHSVVARYVDGKLLWGAVDTAGNEIIPCRYPDLYCPYGQDDVVVFREDEDGPCGLMDFNGRVLSEPKYKYIDSYDRKHGLITARKDGWYMGVYYADSGEMLLPQEYSNVEYCELMMICEFPINEAEGDYDEHYYDYSGNRLEYPEYETASENEAPPDKPIVERKTLVSIGADGRCGLKTPDGRTVIPNVYRNIDIHGKLAVASNKARGGFSINDTLFTLDGEVIISGAIRNLRIFPEKMQMSVETPRGEEFFKIESGI